MVPVYNVEDYLVECLESLVHQSVNKEIILINDGSTDTSDLIIQQYFRRYLFITVINQHNKGLSISRNQGIKLAQGEFIYFVDSDDYIIETNFPSLIELAKQYHVDFLKGQIQMEYMESGEIHKRPPESNSVSENQIYLCSGEQFLHNLLSRDWFPSVFFGLYRTKTLQENKLFFPEGLKAEDALFTINFLLTDSNIKVLEIDRLFYSYRQREKSIIYTITNNSLLVDIFKINQLISKQKDKFTRLIKQKENNPFSTDFSQEQLSRITHNLTRVMAVQYIIGYRYQYLKYSDELKEKSKHLFSPEIIEFVEKYCAIKVQL
ncbi:glycosyltransferase [Rodentibacter abscessus]|uniref:glycosyltransferase n=1 Tax=Rodentibacter abscessus TaxID=3381777 RepID=UPI0021082E49